jgi:hypothetical protein
MSRKISRTCGKFYGIFSRLFEHIGVQTTGTSVKIARK